MRSNVPGKGHSPTRGTPGEPNFHIFPYKTCRTFCMLLRLGRWPYYLKTLTWPARRVTLPARFINTLARPAGQTRSRQDNQSMRERYWFGRHLTEGTRQARRVDSVEGGSFMFWEVFFSARGASLKGGLGHAPPWNFANLGSLKCHFLHFDIISEVGCIFL